MSKESIVAEVEQQSNSKEEVIPELSEGDVTSPKSMHELSKVKFTRAKYQEHMCEVLLHMVVLSGNLVLLDQITEFLKSKVLGGNK